MFLQSQAGPIGVTMASEPARANTLDVDDDDDNQCAHTKSFILL